MMLPPCVLLLIVKFSCIVVMHDPVRRPMRSRTAEQPTGEQHTGAYCSLAVRCVDVASQAVLRPRSTRTTHTAAIMVRETRARSNVKSEPGEAQGLGDQAEDMDLEEHEEAEAEDSGAEDSDDNEGDDSSDESVIVEPEPLPERDALPDRTTRGRRMGQVCVLLLAVLGGALASHSLCGAARKVPWICPLRASQGTATPRKVHRE